MTEKLAKITRRVMKELCIGAILCLVGLILGAPVEKALAATPGVPQPGKTIWQEDFSHGVFGAVNQSSSSPAALMDWTMPSSGLTEAGLPVSYFAESRWARGAVKATSNCNGWVLDSTSSRPETSESGDNCEVLIGQDASGTSREAWWWAQNLAYVLGTAQGMDTNVAASNKVLAEMTTNETNTGQLNQTLPSGIQFKTGSDLGVVSGHYYQLSAWLATASPTCSQHDAGATDAQEAVILTAAGSRLDGINANLCAEGQQFTGNSNLDGADTNFYAKHYTSSAIQIYAYADPTKVAVEVQDSVAAIKGNDIAIDALKLTDVTPQLDHEFTAANRLTYTITNTAELKAKYGWTFTNTLPDGVRPIDGSFGTNCPQVWGWLGGQTVNVGGSLSDGQASCQAWVDVEIAEGGNYTIGAENYDVVDWAGQKSSSLWGLQAPSATAEIITAADAKLELAAKTDTATVNAAGENVIYAFNIKNAGDMAVNLLALNYDGQWQSTGDAPAFSGDKDRLSSMTCSVTPGLGLEKLTLLPGDEVECFFTYKTAQADIDREGGVDLRAVVVGQTVTTHQEVKSAPVGVHVAAGNTPSLALKVLATRANTNQAIDAPLEENEIINYAFVVTNKSLATVREIMIREASPFNGENELLISCPQTALEPFEVMTCHANYTVASADVGETLLSEVYAEGEGTDETTQMKVTSMTDTASLPTPTTQLGLVATKKHLALSNNEAGTWAGDELHYIFTVVNTSNVPLTDVTINDDEHNDGTIDSLEVVTADCQANWPNLGTLAPGEVKVCEAKYTLTQTDIDGGEVASTVAVTGQASGATVNDSDTDIFYAITAPDITILNRTATPGVGEPGDIAYAYTLWNNSNVTLHDVALIDTGPQYGTGQMSAITCNWSSTPGVMTPDEKVNCAATYGVTDADIKANAPLVSTAMVTSVDPTNKIASDEVAATTNILAKGSIMGRVHMDHNMNTFFNTDSEPGMADVTMNLIGVDHHGQMVELTTKTDYKGEYLFTDLLPGTYDVVEPQEPPYHISVYSSAGYYKVDELGRPLPDDSKNGRGSDQVGTGATVADKNTVAGIKIDWGDYNQGNDFGETCGSLGNFVWMDVDRDGYADEGEPGIMGVEMALYFDENSNGIVEDDELTKTMLTDADGHYYFSELNLDYKDDYSVRVTDGNGVLLASGMQPTYTAVKADFGADNCSSHQVDSTVYAETSIKMANYGEPAGWFDWMKVAPYGQLVTLAAPAPTAPNIGLVSLNSNLTADYGFMTATDNSNPSNNSNSGNAASTNNGGTSVAAPTCTAQKPGEPAPYIFKATRNNADSITLHFNVGAQPFTKYLLRYGTAGGVYTFGATLDNPKTGQITVNDLNPGQTYQFQLIPMNDCESGPYSNVFTVSLGQLSKAPGVPNTGLAPMKC